jgi:hypothetical protein
MLSSGLPLPLSLSVRSRRVWVEPLLLLMASVCGGKDCLAHENEGERLKSADDDDEGEDAEEVEDEEVGERGDEGCGKISNRWSVKQ